MKNPSRPGGIGSFVAYAVFGLFAFLALFPLLWMLNNSLKTNAEIFTNVFALPKSPQFANYADAWKIGRLGPKFANTLVYTLTSTALILLVSSMLGYAFAKLPFRKLTRVLYGSLGLGLLITLQAILIPLFIMIRSVNLQDSRLGIVLVYVATGLPISVYLIREYMAGIPDAFIESAKMDGASNALVFFRIVMPVAVPVLVTVSILNVLGVWNEFMLVLVLGNDRTNSLAVGVYSFASTTSQRYDKQMAALVIATFPVVAFYAALNRKITEGVVAGAIKG